MQAQELFQELRHKIRRGELSGKIPSIAELTRCYHISHNTVKKALDMLKMQQLVYGIHGKGVYVRNFVKQKKNPDKILVYCDLTVLHNAFYLRLLNCLRMKAASENFTIDLCTDRRIPDVSGYQLCFIVKGTESPETLKLVSQLAPVRVFGINLEYILPEGMSIPCCCNDNFAGGYLVMEHFYRMGHRRIGIFAVAQELSENIFHHRLRGAEKFAAEHPEMVLSVWNIAGGSSSELDKFAAEIITRHPDITGYFGFTDVVAMRLMNCLENLGKKIPDDVSVIGFDNSDFSGLLNPALTTIEEDADAMAQAVCQMIKEHLGGRSVAEKIVIEPELIERASVKNIKKQPSETERTNYV